MKNIIDLLEKTSFSNGLIKKDADFSQKLSGERPPVIQTLEVAILGLGDWGQQVILSSLENTPFSFIKQFHLIAGENYESVFTQFSKAPKMQVYRAGEYEAVLKNPSISAVIISTPCQTHYELAKTALLAGKHVFVEKTFVLEEAHAAELISLAQKKGLTLMVGYEFMYDDGFSETRDLIKDFAFGEITEIELYLFNMKKGALSNNEKYGTSIVNHHVTHLLSILQTLLGVQRMDKIDLLEAESEYVRLRLRYGGIETTLVAAVDLPNRQNYRTVIIRGTEKTLEIAFDGPHPVFTLKKTSNAALISAMDEEYPRPFQQTFTTTSVQREFEHFFDCMTQNRRPLSGGQTALHLVKMTDQIEKSYQEKMRVEQEQFADEAAQTRQDILQIQKTFLLEKSQDVGSSFEINTSEINTLKQNETQALKGVETTLAVVNYLSHKPYASADEIAKHLNLNLDALKTIYQIMQRVPGVQKIFSRGDNYDYFKVVERFFEQNHYEVTFFVGLSCPYKCSFCRMTMASQEKKEGYLGQGEIDGRSLRFSLKKPDLLKYHEVVKVLDGLEDMRDLGRPVTVKISGGLEPLSDPERVAFILDAAKKRGFPVRIYSNGILANTPDKREIVLSCDDFRISLNALNEDYFQDIYRLGTTKSKKISYANIETTLRELVAERTRLGSKTRIGINYVVVKGNIYEMWLMVALCRDIGLDYINFNTDYCDDFDDKAYIAIDQQIKKIKTMQGRGDFLSLKIEFGGALLKNNVFAKQPQGEFDPGSMAKLKVFVDPAGEVTPVHEGTYPFRTSEGKTEQNPYVLGKLSGETNLKGLLKEDHALSPIEFRYLAPFELILGLELMREEKDEACGIRATDSPYRRSETTTTLMS